MELYKNELSQQRDGGHERVREQSKKKQKDHEKPEEYQK